MKGLLLQRAINFACTPQDWREIINFNVYHKRLPMGGEVRFGSHRLYGLLAVVKDVNCHHRSCF